MHDFCFRKQFLELMFIKHPYLVKQLVSMRGPALAVAEQIWIQCDD